MSLIRLASIRIFLAARCGAVGSEQNLGVAASLCGFEFDCYLLEKHHMQLKTAS